MPSGGPSTQTTLHGCLAFHSRLLDAGFRRYDGEELNDLFNELWFQDTSMTSQCDYLPIPKVSLYSLVNSLKLGPTISGLTTR